MAHSRASADFSTLQNFYLSTLLVDPYTRAPNDCPIPLAFRGNECPKRIGRPERHRCALGKEPQSHLGRAEHPDGFPVQPCNHCQWCSNRRNEAKPDSPFRPTIPASAIVGTSWITSTRCDEVTASARTLPACNDSSDMARHRTSCR